MPASTDLPAARMRAVRRALVVLGAAGAVTCAAAADYDLCVRGVSLDTIRTARLKLTVEGADVAPFAARLGAVLANRRFWDSRAEEVFGAPYDADLCGEAVAPELHLAISLTAEQAHDLEAEVTRGGGAGLGDVVTRLLGGVPPPPPRPEAPAARPPTAEPVRDAEGRVLYNIVRVYYATDRKETADPAPERHYAGDRGALTLGVVEVTLPRAHSVGVLEAPSVLRLEFKADPGRHVTLKSLRVLDTEAWRSEVAKRASSLGNPGVLLFIHGYNTRFGDAALRAGQLSFDLGFSGATVLFSWPSRGAVIDYTVDEQAAEWSVPDMKAVLASLATISPGTPVYVVAHSMGNRVLTRGFKALLDEDLAKRRAFRQIVLAAPDIDADVFKRDIAPGILGKGPRITLYASSNDKALAASRNVHGGYRRLGESGDDIVVMPDLDTIDASTVSTEFLGHSYFGDSATVMSDLIYVIRKSLPPQERTRYALEPVRAAIGQYWRFKAH